MFNKLQKYLKVRQNLSTVIELLGVVIVWWGIWGILDIFVFPENRLFSYLISICLGVLILFLNGSGLDDIK